MDVKERAKVKARRTRSIVVFAQTGEGKGVEQASKKPSRRPT